MNKGLSVSEVSKAFGVSVRTLHYYDEIGLLQPTEITEAGYRRYDEEALEILQQVLFYRELEFPLKEIKDILSAPDYNKVSALKEHKNLLELKRNHIDALINLVNKSIGGDEMKNIQKTADEIEKAKEKYSAEVSQRWVKTDAYKESKMKHDSYTSEKEIAIAEEADQIFGEFAKNMNLEPSDPKVQELVKRWQDHITKFHYNCTKEILSGLGLMYTADTRFTENLDKFGDGNAKFMSEAIAWYCNH